MELQAKQNKDNANSNFWSWINIGDVIEGLYIDYEQKAGQFGKPQVTIKTRDGKKFVNCTKDLQDKLEEPALAGDLDGKWLRIEYVGDKDVKKENPMKLFKVECFDSAPPKPATHKTTQAPSGKPAREAGDDSDQEPPPF